MRRTTSPDCTPLLPVPVPAVPYIVEEEDVREQQAAGAAFERTAETLFG
ncbi:hypothetical protein ACWCQZ_43220 [Streptomyces sp. NPDC002285]